MNLAPEKERRVFAAIPISSSLQREILAWEKKHATLPVRWLAGKNIHITLVPPWHETNCDDAIQLLKRVGGGGEIDIEFRDVSYGPSRQEPRLIWASGNAPRKLLDLKKQVEKAFGKKSEYRPWLMHLTIARFDPRDFPKFPIKNLNEKVSWKERISSVVLMESLLKPSGADYEIIAEIKL